MLIRFLGIILLFNCIWFCKKPNNDKIRPVIDYFSISNNSVEVNTSFVLSAQLSDNEELSSYKITVTNDFNFNTGEITETTRFTYGKVFEIGNESFYDINVPISIPVTASAGPYLVYLDVLDTKGNVGEQKTISLEITNAADQPTVSLTNPVGGATYSQGDTITAMGNITDNKTIGFISFKTRNETGIFYAQNFNVDTNYISNWDMQMDGQLKIPLPNLTGNYSLTIEARDTTGNMKRIVTPFVVN